MTSQARQKEQAGALVRGHGDTFKEATRLAKVTGRRFYLAQPQA